MKTVLKFKNYGRVNEIDISNYEEDLMDNKTFLNINQVNWEYLKDILTKEQLLELIENNPNWLEFAI
jgi:hypothetical protein